MNISIHIDILHDTQYFILLSHILIKTIFFPLQYTTLNLKYIKLLNGGIMLPGELHKHKAYRFRKEKNM